MSIHRYAKELSDYFESSRIAFSFEPATVPWLFLFDMSLTLSYPPSLVYDIAVGLRPRISHEATSDC